jgi:hypothetical protein
VRCYSPVSVPTCFASGNFIFRWKTKIIAFFVFEWQRTNTQLSLTKPLKTEYSITYVSNSIVFGVILWFSYQLIPIFAVVCSALHAQTLQVTCWQNIVVISHQQFISSWMSIMRNCRNCHNITCSSYCV